MNVDAAAQLDELDFAKGDGLLPVIVQHAHTGEVLMLAYANRDSLERTLADRVMWFYSRSRAELWRKGATSGNVQHLVSLHGDCDADAVIARVLPDGPACHTGARNCFEMSPTLTQLDALIDERTQDPAGGGYTRRLLSDRNLRLKKLGEESVELALACERGDREAVAEEAADLLYHALVACRAAEVSLTDVLAVLAGRAETTG